MYVAVFALLARAACGQGPAVVAGVPANYDESLVGSYTLPDPLNGVRSAKEWTKKRRPEVLRLFEENQFGAAPGRPKDMSFDVFDKGTPAFDGKALRRQVTVHFGKDRKMDLLLYLPAQAKKKVPVLLNLSFMANSSVVDDAGVRQGEIWGKEKKRIPAPRGSNFGRLVVEPLLQKGIGVATVYYGDIDPDFDGGAQYGVRSVYSGTWGAIAAWAWGLSRALDYLETDKGVDAKKVGIFGVSRLGKTVLWAGASDPRIALVIASCSGEGGAALSRRNYGELVKHMNLRFGYQFCANYQKWGDRVSEMPVDSHMLLALIAPRPVLLQTGDKDFWSDPKGELLAAEAARPVFRLFGGRAAAMPEYFMHAGGHGTIPSDWDVFLKFLEASLR